MRVGRLPAHKPFACFQQHRGIVSRQRVGEIQVIDGVAVLTQVRLETYQEKMTPVQKQIDKIKAMVFRDDNRDVSQQFGSYLQNGLRQVASGKDRGTKPGPFWVLVGATGHMPAVLVELGFITHGKDVKNLTSEGYQQRLAEGIPLPVGTVENLQMVAGKLGVALPAELA